jgi:hypothetical protein
LSLLAKEEGMPLTASSDDMGMEHRVELLKKVLVCQVGIHIPPCDSAII